MKYDPEIHHRRSIRLHGYDYSKDGLYFITLCTYGKLSLFGHIKNGEMVLNDAGKNALNCWQAISEHFPEVVLHEYILMPNHIHGIIEIRKESTTLSSAPSTQTFKSPSKTIGSIVRGFKIGVTKWFRTNTDVKEVWQRNYWEHIVRDSKAYQEIANYIITNPQNWERDKLYMYGRIMIRPYG